MNHHGLTFKYNRTCPEWRLNFGAQRGQREFTAYV